MRYRDSILVTSLMALLVAGCAGSSQNGAQVRDVTRKDFGIYWIMDPGSFIAALGASGALESAKGCFRARTIIGSDGKLIDPEVVAVWGADGFKDWAPKFLANLQYTPSVTNAARTPIRTTLQWSFYNDAMSFTLTKDQIPDPTPEQQAAIAAHKAFTLTSEQMDKLQGAKLKSASPTQATQDAVNKCEAELDMQYPAP